MNFLARVAKSIISSCLLLVFPFFLAGQAKASSPKRIVFEKLSAISGDKDKVIDAVINQFDFSDKGAEYNNSPLDTSVSDMLMELVKEGIAKGLTNSETLIIEKHGDTIWRHKEVDGKIIGDYERIASTGTIFIHAKVNRALQYDSFHVFKNVGNGKLVADKADRKRIFGIDCFKATITLSREAGDDFFSNPGDQVIEMYVTEEIVIPAHAVVYVDKLYHFFPLEINSWHTNFPGIVDRVILKEIIFGDQ